MVYIKSLVDFRSVLCYFVFELCVLEEARKSVNATLCVRNTHHGLLLRECNVIRGLFKVFNISGLFSMCVQTFLLNLRIPIHDVYMLLTYERNMYIQILLYGRY